MDTQGDIPKKFSPFHKPFPQKQSTEDANVSVVQSQNSPPTLVQLETEIKFHLRQASQSIIEVGKRLLQAKSLVKHGEWRTWLKCSLCLLPKTRKNLSNKKPLRVLLIRYDS